MFARISRLPQPLRALHWVFLAVFTANFVNFLAGTDRTLAAGFGLLGAVAVLLGLTVLTNLNGAADAMAETTAADRRMGIGHSRSWMATPTFARFYGLAMALIGTNFIIQAALTY